MVAFLTFSKTASSSPRSGRETSPSKDVTLEDKTTAGSSSRSFSAARCLSTTAGARFRVNICLIRSSRTKALRKSAPNAPVDPVSSTTLSTPVRSLRGLGFTGGINEEHLSIMRFMSARLVGYPWFLEEETLSWAFGLLQESAHIRISHEEQN